MKIPIFRDKVIYLVFVIKRFLSQLQVLLRLLLPIPWEVGRWVRGCVMRRCHLFLNHDSPFRKRIIVVLVGSIASQEIIFLLQNYSLNKCILLDEFEETEFHLG